MSEAQQRPRATLPSFNRTPRARLVGFVRLFLSSTIAFPFTSRALSYYSIGYYSIKIASIHYYVPMVSVL